MNTYKRFSVDDVVTVKSTTNCQYFDYPDAGDNQKTLKPGEVAIIVSIMPKVRINAPDTGEYFFNLLRYNSKHDKMYYPVMDYHDLVKL